MFYDAALNVFRILKIEDMLESILSNIEITDRLSFEERLFATKLNSLKQSMIEESILNRLTEEVKEQMLQSDDLLVHSQPNLQVSIITGPIIHIFTNSSCSLVYR
jgi:hypothetical protein